MKPTKNIHGVIFDLQKYSIRDGPGIRTTVFLKGCPLRCAWCQNPESIDPRPESLGGNPSRGPSRGGTRTAGKLISVPDVMSEVGKDRVFYDFSGGGATFSGGEPLMQPEFLAELLRSCRRRGFHTAVDTSGYADWPVLNRIRPFVDLFLYDLKIMDPALHRRLTGQDNGRIIDNLRRLDRSRARVVIRVPVIPGVTDTRANIGQIGRLLAGLKNVRRLDLLPYNDLCKEKYQRLNRPYRFAKLNPPTIGSLNRIRDRLSNYGLEVGIGG